jgi:hypothetical protein
MGKSVYISLLIKDYRRKAGEVRSLRKDLREMAKVVLERESDLRALETVICNRVPGIDLSLEKPINTWPKVSGLKWNQLTVLILACLREAEGRPVRSDLISDYVIVHGYKEIEDRRELTVIRRSVHDRLKGMVRTGKVVRHHNKQTRGFGVWSLPGDE